MVEITFRMHSCHASILFNHSLVWIWIRPRTWWCKINGKKVFKIVLNVQEIFSLWHLVLTIMSPVINDLCKQIWRIKLNARLFLLNRWWHEHGWHRLCLLYTFTVVVIGLSVIGWIDWNTALLLVDHQILLFCDLLLWALHLHLLFNFNICFYQYYFYVIKDLA